MARQKVREGSAPNFCPPTEEGIVLSLVDEKNEEIQLEFLGLLIKGETKFGFFFPVSEDEPALSSGEVVILEVIALDEDGQPAEFELVDDLAIAQEAYEDFKVATKDLYRFE